MQNPAYFQHDFSFGTGLDLNLDHNRDWSYFDQRQGSMDSERSLSNPYATVQPQTTPLAWASNMVHQGPTSAYAQQPTSFPRSYSSNWPLQSWGQADQSYTPGEETSPGLLPIQRPTDDPNINMQSSGQSEVNDTGKELVGMGLYDLPDSSQSFLLTGAQSSTGKGLKLEETFQPPEADEDDEDDNMSSDEESPDEPPNAQDQQWSVQTGNQLMPDLSGQSFFFDDDETYTNEWWYPPLKQSAVQGTNFGYGWL
ncbi:hypothetical protein H2201_007768 [Coniosporium apollinis]|uniref:WW domain-containing protein n=1 Tax=Coniosporium apollinis TaxID=61459 RepID=A0ABQ9NLS5_9PEZI|nr:hypothetical protein H2201_007768 [Coniosporium apollinis]